MVEGSKAHSKGGSVRKRTTLNGRGLKGALERGEGSKAHSKGGRKIHRIFRWSNSRGVKNFSKVKKI